MTVTSGRLADFVVSRRMLAITALALPIGALSAGATWCLIRLIGLVTNLVSYQRWGTRHLIAFGRRPGRPVDNPPEPSAP
jgi:chloride channel protein, CIC family